MFWSEPNRLFTQTLLKMEPKLAEEGYVGYIDLNCIVNNNGIYPLEFTSRFGYPTISIQQEGMLTPISELLLGTCQRSRAQVAHAQRFSNRRSHRRSAVSVRRRRNFRILLQKRRHRLQEAQLTDRYPHRRRKTAQRPVADRGHFRRRPDRRRHRPHHETSPGPGLFPHQKHPDPQHVLPHRHRRPLGRRLRQTPQLGLFALTDFAYYGSRLERISLFCLVAGLQTLAVDSVLRASAELCRALCASTSAHSA